MTSVMYALLALNLALGFYLWYKFFSKSNTKRTEALQGNNSVPLGPRGLPIFGNLLQLGQRPYIRLFELSGEYGPIFRIKLGSQDIVVLNRYDCFL